VTSLADAVEGPDAIGLDQLNARAELQTRSTRKYVVDVGLVATMFRSVGRDLAVLEIDGARLIDYETVYFDTPDRALYLDTARRRPRRFKVRTRQYENASAAMLEIKEKNGRDATVKHRTEYPSEHRRELRPDARAWIDSIVKFDATDLLEPTLVTRFGRSAAISRLAEERFTFDTGLVCATPDGSTVGLDGIIVECKSPGSSTSIDRWLWRHGIRPIQLSKYCTGLASIDPSLPSNHWHRTLNTYFAA
jgi:inorganic triphosphatase YgiF